MRSKVSKDITHLEHEMDIWFGLLFAFVGLIGYELTQRWWTISVGIVGLILFGYMKLKDVKGGTQ